MSVWMRMCIYVCMDEDVYLWLCGCVSVDVWMWMCICGCVDVSLCL